MFLVHLHTMLLQLMVVDKVIVLKVLLQLESPASYVVRLVIILGLALRRILVMEHHRQRRILSHLVLDVVV